MLAENPAFQVDRVYSVFSFMLSQDSGSYVETQNMLWNNK